MGRDPEFKCIYCGKYVAYKDIGKTVITKYVPDTDYSTDRTEMWHIKCDTYGDRK